METVYQDLSTENWSVSLPDSWTPMDKPNIQGFYFESEDEEQGLYIATWQFPENESQSDAELASNFIDTDRRSFNEMEGYNWKFFEFGCQENISVVDAYDSGNNYRISCKVISKLPILIRTAFHDYNCQDYKSSKQMSDIILGSLKVAGGA